MKFNGEGIQHVALLTDDLLATDRQARAGRRAADDGAERRLLRDARAAPAGPRRDRRRAADARHPARRQHRGRQAAPAAADLLARPCSARCSSSSSSARATTASAKATSRRCSSRSSATRCGAACSRRHERRRRSPYQSGFGNEFATEALPGALPVGRNSPQRAPYGLYAEQLSGTAFTAPRADNRRSWLYRIRPVGDAPAVRAHRRRPHRRRASTTSPAPPNQLRWNPLPMPSDADRLRRRPGDDGRQRRPACADRRGGAPLRGQPLDAAARCFYDADGELLIVPQQGRQRFVTELGMIDVEPQEIVVIPRGVRFRVELPDGDGARLRLRELRRATSACPTSARSARTASPTRATS